MSKPKIDKRKSAMTEDKKYVNDGRFAFSNICRACNSIGRCGYQRTFVSRPKGIDTPYWCAAKVPCDWVQYYKIERS